MQCLLILSSQNILLVRVEKRSVAYWPGICSHVCLEDNFHQIYIHALLFSIASFRVFASGEMERTNYFTGSWFGSHWLSTYHGFKYVNRRSTKLPATGLLVQRVICDEPSRRHITDPLWVEFTGHRGCPSKGSVARKAYPCYYVIMYLMGHTAIWFPFYLGNSLAQKASIWIWSRLGVHTQSSNAHRKLPWQWAQVWNSVAFCQTRCTISYFIQF